MTLPPTSVGVDRRDWLRITLSAEALGIGNADAEHGNGKNRRVKSEATVHGGSLFLARRVVGPVVAPLRSHSPTDEQRRDGFMASPHPDTMRRLAREECAGMPCGT